MQSYNDRWERTKRYLLRNFLVNPGFQLSPIPEEARSSSSSPESLPELVVEPEPDRHDHEPEYYEGLERRMRQYYRQLFLDESDNEDSSDFEVNQSMASTFIIDSINNAREDPPALNHAVTGQINDYSDKDKDMYVYKMIGEKSTGSDENESVDCETSKALTEERSSDSDKDEFKVNEEAERFSPITDKDQFEANHVVTEEKHADSDKTSGSENVTAEDMSADSDTDENLLEVADVVTEERRLDSYKDISDNEDIVTEANIADSDTDEDALEENYVINKSSDSEINELSKHDVVIEERRSGYNKDKDISEAEDIVREDIRHGSDKEDCMPEANSAVIEEHTMVSDKTTALSEANRVADGKLIDDVVDEVASTINEKQVTYTRDIKLPDNHVVSPHKDALLIDFFKESSSFDEVGNSKLIRSRSGYFLVSCYNKSNIDLNEITTPDYLIQSSQVVSFQGDATNQSHDRSDLNKRLEAIDKDLSKTKSTSDSDESGPCHIISSTVVEVHEIRPTTMRKLEDASPILIPKSVRVSRGVSVPDDDRREACLSLSGDLEISDEIIARVSYDPAENNEDEANIGQPDTTVERLLSFSEVTNVAPDSERFNSDMPDDYVSDNRNINQEEDAVERNYHIIQEEIRPGYSKPFTDDEESIGPDEFQYSTLDSKITERTGENDSDWNSNDTDENSFEIALRRGIFESKNVLKTYLQSSDEEMDTTDEDFEPVEETRAPREFDMRESLHRASVGTQDSPGLAFERQTSADKLEDVSTDSHEINASLEKVSERKSCRDPYHTPPIHKTNVVSALDDIWSVSPMELDIEQLLKETAPNKKRKPETDAEDEPIERKKRKDIAIQTSLSNQQSWEDIKTNFFVGKPLVLRLCGCPDHVCSKPTSQTG